MKVNRNKNQGDKPQFRLPPGARKALGMSDHPEFQSLGLTGRIPEYVEPVPPSDPGRFVTADAVRRFTDSVRLPGGQEQLTLLLNYFSTPPMDEPTLVRMKLELGMYADIYASGHQTFSAQDFRAFMDEVKLTSFPWVPNQGVFTTRVAGRVNIIAFPRELVGFGDYSWIQAYLFRSLMSIKGVEVSDQDFLTLFPRMCPVEGFDVSEARQKFALARELPRFETRRNKEKLNAFGELIYIVGAILDCVTAHNRGSAPRMASPEMVAQIKDERFREAMYERMGASLRDCASFDPAVKFAVDEIGRTGRKPKELDAAEILFARGYLDTALRNILLNQAAAIERHDLVAYARLRPVMSLFHAVKIRASFNHFEMVKIEIKRYFAGQNNAVAAGRFFDYARKAHADFDRQLEGTDRNGEGVKDFLQQAKFYLDAKLLYSYRQALLKRLAGIFLGEHGIRLFDQLNSFFRSPLEVAMDDARRSVIDNHPSLKALPGVDKSFIFQLLTSYYGTAVCASRVDMNMNTAMDDTDMGRFRDLWQKINAINLWPGAEDSVLGLPKPQMEHLTWMIEEHLARERNDFITEETGRLETVFHDSSASLHLDMARMLALLIMRAAFEESCGLSNEARVAWEVKHCAKGAGFQGFDGLTGSQQIREKLAQEIDELRSVYGDAIRLLAVPEEMEIIKGLQDRAREIERLSSAGQARPASSWKSSPLRMLYLETLLGALTGENMSVTPAAAKQLLEQDMRTDDAMVRGIRISQHLARGN